MFVLWVTGGHVTAGVMDFNCWGLRGWGERECLVLVCSLPTLQCAHARAASLAVLSDPPVVGLGADAAGHLYHSPTERRLAADGHHFFLAVWLA